MTRLLGMVLLGLALTSGCKRHDDDPPAVRDRAREVQTASDDDWTGALADRDGGTSDGGISTVKLPAPGRPWTAQCGEVVDHMNALLIASLVGDGASELEIGQLRKRIDTERSHQIEHCAARVSEGEVRCLLIAKSADNLAACNRP